MNDKETLLRRVEELMVDISIWQTKRTNDRTMSNELEPFTSTDGLLARSYGLLSKFKDALRA